MNSRSLYLGVVMVVAGIAGSAKAAMPGSESVSSDERESLIKAQLERRLLVAASSERPVDLTYSKSITPIATQRSEGRVLAKLVTYGALPSLDMLPSIDDPPASDDTSATAEQPPAGKHSILRELFACDAPADWKWSFEFGVGVISDNVPGDYTQPKLIKLDGPGGGLTYNFTVSRRIHQFAWNIGSVTLRPELEIPARLTLVDENSGHFIPDLNIGLVLRWKDFPWNKFLRMTIAFGGGLSYSFQPWTADYVRHPEDPERSRLKFWIPIEFTLALPRFPHHQLVAFVDHQSGGWLVDEGGVDAWGLGYRIEF